MKKRIDRILIQKRLCSQRSAKIFFKKHGLFVNGRKITDNKFLVQPGDKIQIQKNMPDRQDFFNDDSNEDSAEMRKKTAGEDFFEFSVPEDWYIIMNKPAHLVCSHVSDSHKTVFQIINPSLLNQIEGCGQTLHSVGRLDAETEGLLILTTDGALSHFLASPESKIEKTYFARLKRPVPEKKQIEYTESFFKGLTLPAEKKAPEESARSSRLIWLSDRECKVTVTEGKFHEVRRLFLAVGNEVEYLKRLSFGGLDLTKLELEPGQYKIFTDFPLELVKADCL